MTNYPFTREELFQQITEIWDNNKIDFQAISDFYRQNDWKWGDWDEPKYIPEFRDIKRAISRGFLECREDFLNQFFTNGVELDYKTADNVVNYSRGQFEFEMYWIECDTEGEEEYYIPSFSVSIKFGVATIGIGHTENYLSKEK